MAYHSADGEGDRASRSSEDLYRATGIRKVYCERNINAYLISLLRKYNFWVKLIFH